MSLHETLVHIHDTHALLRGSKPECRHDFMLRLAGFAGMNGSRLQHLLRRNGTYYLRVRVPTDLQALVGLSEVRRTLGVHVLSKAKPLALKLASRVLETFVVLQQRTYSRDEARLLVQSCFAALSANLDHGFVPETDDPEMELAEQENAWAEAVLGSGDFGLGRPWVWSLSTI